MESRAVDKAPAIGKTWLRFIVSLCLSIFLAFFPKVLLAAATEDEAARELQTTLDQLNALTVWLDDAEKQRVTWISELRVQDQAIARVNKDVDELSDKVEETNQQLSELTEKQTKLKAEQLGQAELIADHVAAAYRLTGQDFLKQILNQESPDEFQRMIRYHRIFSESRLELLADYQSTLAELEDTNVRLSEQQVELTARQTTLVDEQNNLSSERKNRASLIANLDAEKETKSQEFKRLEKDRIRLESLLAELRRRSTELDGSDFLAAKRALPMPIEGSIRHAFGSRRADGRLRWHGIDIRAAHGTPVTAVFRGKVVFADWLRGFGLLTILDHGSGYMTLYGHADVLHKKVGDYVESGEIIAGAGNSGGKKETGVYFEVRHKGEPKDPINWINR